MNKKTILAFILVGLIIILMPYYYNLIMPEKPESKTPPAVKDTTVAPTQIPPPVKETAHPLKDTLETDRVSIPDEVWQDSKDITAGFAEIETPLYHATFDLRGAKIISFRLKEYSDRKGGITELTPRNEQGDFYPNSYMTFPKLNLSTDELYFRANHDRITIDAGEKRELVLSAKLKAGGEILFRYTFYGDDYRIGLETRSQGINLAEDYYFRWDGGVNITETDTLRDITYSKAYSYMGGELEVFDAPGKGEKRLNPSGTVDWIAVRSKYFEIAVIPEGNTQGIDFIASKYKKGKFQPKEFKLALKLTNPSGNLEQKYRLYIGPMDSKRLSSMGVGLESTMNWGWAIIKPFSIAILWSFKQLHTIVPNYGVVIIIFSILIKIILWPLTQKSYKSMREMQKLQPYLKELREKYKSDPQKMQKETAKLYKEHKVNPMGGCLPVLLQMPLLYALFIVFQSTIELRGAPFMLWIKDLSLPDYVLHLGFTIPMYGDAVAILPLIMGITTFFQSKSSMTDPSQKMMLYFMPVFLTLLFNSFPSGLTLYYALFNVLSMLHQMWMQKKDEAVVVIS
jgi:YidC/Oxa1 family membrane protein insertase